MTHTSSRRNPSLLFVAVLLATCLSRPLFSDESTLSRATVEQKLQAGESLAGAQLAGADLAGLNAANANLGGINAEKADLRGASLTDCYLDRANLKGVKARGVTMRGCSLLDAALDGADFSGARLETVDLMGASLAGCNFAGAKLTDLRFSPNGMYYTEGLRAALQTILGEKVSIPFVCGITGDAFSFVYNSSDPSYQPSLPFTANPLIAATEALGIKATYREGGIYAAAMNRLSGNLLANGICLIPMHLETLPDIGDIGYGPFAGVVTKLNKEKRDVSFDVTVPAFGTRKLTRVELEQCWLYQLPSLEPMRGQTPMGNFELLMLPSSLPQKASKPAPKSKKNKASGSAEAAAPAPAPAPAWNDDAKRAAALTAIRHALILANDERTYANLWPGIMGLNVLAADLHTASNKEDAASVLRMAAWEGRPRRDLIGARKQAATFLQEVAPLFAPLVQGDLTTAATLYASEAQLLALRWPSIQPDPKAKPDLDVARAACRKAGQLVLEMAALENQAVDALVRATKPEAPAPK